MKKRIKQLLCVFLGAVVLILAFGGAATKPQLSKNNFALTLEYIENGEPLSGAEFELYYVASVDESGKFSLTDEFAAYPVDVSSLEKDALNAAAQALAGYIKRDKIEPFDSGETDENGLLVFPNKKSELKDGLYLVSGKQTEKDGYTYKTEPFFVSLPCRSEESGAYLSQVTVSVKHSKEKKDGETTERKIIKNWKNDSGIKRPQKVTVDLLKDGEVFQTVSLSAENNWRYEWKNLPKYDKDELEIDWVAVEREVKDYNVSVSYSGETILLTNEYEPDFPQGETTKRSVQKIWDDKGYEKKRPKSVEVELLKNGEPFLSATLSQSGGWSHTWDFLDTCDENGEYITWSLREKPISGYSAKTQLKGYTFVLTNSYEKPEIPRTGMPWWPVLMLASAGILLLLIGILLKKRNENE